MTDIEQRICPICKETFCPRYTRYGVNVWEYNYYCSGFCFQKAEEMMHDALLDLKNSGIQIPENLSWISEENKALRTDQNSIDWMRLCILKNSSTKNFPPMSSVVDDDSDEFEIVKKEKPVKPYVEDESIDRPGPGQKACSFCKKPIGVRSIKCKYCKNVVR